MFPRTLPLSPSAEEARNVLRRAHEEFKAVALQRGEAIRAAAQAGVPLREISRAVENSLSYEVIRGMVGPKAGAGFSWRDEVFEVSEPQLRALIYKADAYGHGGARGDVELLGVGDDWLPAARDLAEWMRRARAGLETDPIALDESHAWALLQILRLTYTDGVSRLSALRTAFFSHFGTLHPQDG